MVLLRTHCNIATISKEMAGWLAGISLYFICSCIATVADHGQPKGLVLHAEGPLSFTTYFYYPSISARRQGTVYTIHALKDLYTNAGFGLSSVFGDW